MGQYYIAVNLDKKQILTPHACGDGAKLLEFALGSCGIMAGMAILLADGNGRGGGDLFGAKCEKCEGHGVLYRKDGEVRRDRKGHIKMCKTCKAVGRGAPPAIVGSWAGDRVVICGDYGDRGKFVPKGPHRVDDVSGDERNLYDLVTREGSEYKDVSREVMRALAADSFVSEQLQQRGSGELSTRLGSRLLQDILSP